jgi:hypothetical protein
MKFYFRGVHLEPCQLHVASFPGHYMHSISTKQGLKIMCKQKMDLITSSPVFLKFSLHAEMTELDLNLFFETVSGLGMRLEPCVFSLHGSIEWSHWLRVSSPPHSDRAVPAQALPPPHTHHCGLEQWNYDDGLDNHLGKKNGWKKYIYIQISQFNMASYACSWHHRETYTR